MSQTSAAPASTTVEVPSIPFAQIAPWALFAGLLAVLALFFVSSGQGAVHEWVHAGRHLLGYPCH